MYNENTKQHPQEDDHHHDPRVEFVDNIAAQIRVLLFHDPIRTAVHEIRISVDLVTTDEEVSIHRRRTFGKEVM
jgi:hypothetical protein